MLQPCYRCYRCFPSIFLAPESKKVDESSTMSLAVPQPLHNILTSTNTSKQLYESLSAEHKAKIAVINAVVNCPREFHGRYRINGIVGYGGNGVVLSATQVTNNITVAVKSDLYPSCLPNETGWRRDQPFYPCFSGKLRCVGVGDYASKVFAKLEGHKRLPVEAVKCIVLQAAKALRELHSHGYYHGDVKLENLIIGMEDTRGLYVVLADFGHAKKVSSGICKYGTENAVPPEFLVGSPYLGNALDGREADVFALGMVLYILLSESGNLQDFHGRIDWESINLNEGKFPFQFGEEFSTDSRDLLQQMCMVNPKGRISIQGVVDHQWF
ncbi:kinase-like protein [Rhizoclosmatium globosum]|uniref:Kinase-like protein n=1 Tax=Rhizoclosmatium globosum TaxID=329046 RepID=A0A1Y2CIZ6_9FUNG|nr:kinase-like protein [Rhizoclosmatium globosum]|eukprot:ORY46936.1 kinase-like protein [Rhizoclosmatium globosum]